MRGKRKRSNTVRNASIIALIIVFFIILAALNQSEQRKPAYKASDYFEISDAEYIGYLAEHDQLLLITQLRFTITAVKGDAHNVFVQSINSLVEDGMVGTGTLLKGQSETAYISYTSEAGVPMDDDGQFIVEVHVSSGEAIGPIYVPITP